MCQGPQGSQLPVRMAGSSLLHVCPPGRTRTFCPCSLSPRVPRSTWSERGCKGPTGVSLESRRKALPAFLLPEAFPPLSTALPPGPGGRGLTHGTFFSPQELWA